MLTLEPMPYQMEIPRFLAAFDRLWDFSKLPDAKAHRDLDPAQRPGGNRENVFDLLFPAPIPSMAFRIIAGRVHLPVWAKQEGWPDQVLDVSISIHLHQETIEISKPAPPTLILARAILGKLFDDLHAVSDPIWVHAGPSAIQFLYPVPAWVMVNIGEI